MDRLAAARNMPESQPKSTHPHARVTQHQECRTTLEVASGPSLQSTHEARIRGRSAALARATKGPSLRSTRSMVLLIVPQAWKRDLHAFVEQRPRSSECKRRFPVPFGAGRFAIAVLAAEQHNAFGASIVTPTTLTPTTRIDDKHDGRGERERPARRLPIGADVQPGGGVHFRIWAPNCEKLDVVFESENEADALEPLELVPEGNGYFSGTALARATACSIATGGAAATATPTRPHAFSPRGRMVPLRSWIPASMPGTTMTGRG